MEEKLENLERIKKKIRTSYDYNKSNYITHSKNKRFLIYSSMTSEEVDALADQGKPQLEFNTLLAYFNRWVGEFSKQEPDIKTNSTEESAVNADVVKFSEQHMKYFLLDYNNEHTKLQFYRDIAAGGFGALKIYTEYENEMSLRQQIKIKRLEPTLVGWDLNARLTHKGDGNFIFELIPMTKDQFQEEYPDIDIKDLEFNQQLEGFNWSYKGKGEEIILLCDFYEKKMKDTVRVQLVDGRTMDYKNYKKMVDTWENIELPPEILGKPVKKKITTIKRYRLIQSKIIEEKETDFDHLPIVIGSGVTDLVMNSENSTIQEVFISAFNHAQGAQRLKNYAGNCLANGLENMSNAKFIVKKEGLPKEQEWLESFRDPQKANMYVVNAFYENNPDQPIPDPLIPFPQIPLPPEVAQTFSGADSLIQNVLGSYDASLGINDNQLSGIAIVEAASQSNATAMPYINGVLEGLQRAAQIYIDLMPKYYTTPRTLPIIDEKGRKSFVKVNQKDGIKLDYEPNALNVIVKAGASFQVQKSRTLMMVKEMMGMSPLFAQFMSEKGLNFILDNMEGKGVEELKMLVDEWLKEYQQQKQAAMQKAQQDPNMMKPQIEMAKIQQKSQETQGKLAVDMGKLKQAEQKLMSDVLMSQESARIQELKVHAEIFSKHADLEMSKKDMIHRHLKEAAEIHHKNMVHKDNIENRNRAQ